MLELIVGKTGMHLTLEDLMEYKKYRDVGLAVKEIHPSVTILSPTEWYRKFKANKIYNLE